MSEPITIEELTKEWDRLGVTSEPDGCFTIQDLARTLRRQESNSAMLSLQRKARQMVMELVAEDRVECVGKVARLRIDGQTGQVPAYRFKQKQPEKKRR